MNDVRVSRGHARLQKLADGIYEITNLTSTRSEPNPITINGEEKDKAILKDGDVVSLNGVNFQIPERRLGGVPDACSSFSVVSPILIRSPNLIG